MVQGGALHFIPKQIHRAAVGGKQQVQAAVVIEIRVGGPAPHSGRGECLPKGLGDLFEFPFANIAKQMRWHGVFHVRLHALDVGIDVAVRDQHIWPAVKVIIEEKAAEAESEQGSAPDLRARSFVDKESFSFIVIERQHLVRKIGDQQAGEAGMVVIRRIHTHAGAGHAIFTESDSCDDRFFRKCAVAIVAVKLVRLRIIRKHKIGPTVVVEIEHGDTKSFRSGVSETGFLR